MKYAFVMIRTKEMEVVDENNCIKHLIKGFTVTPIDEIIAKSDEEAIKLVVENYQKVLSSYELDEDYMEWFKKSMSDDGKTIFASLYKLSEYGETIDWRYNG